MIHAAKRLLWAGLVLDLAAAPAQESLANAPEPTRAVKAPMLPGGLPEKPSQPPLPEPAILDAAARLPGR